MWGQQRPPPQGHPYGRSPAGGPGGPGWAPNRPPLPPRPNMPPPGRAQGGWERGPGPGGGPGGPGGGPGGPGGGGAWSGNKRDAPHADWQNGGGGEPPSAKRGRWDERPGSSPRSSSGWDRGPESSSSRTPSASSGDGGSSGWDRRNGNQSNNPRDSSRESEGSGGGNRRASYGWDQPPSGAGPGDRPASSSPRAAAGGMNTPRGAGTCKISLDTRVWQTIGNHSSAKP